MAAKQKDVTLLKQMKIKKKGSNAATGTVGPTLLVLIRKRLIKLLEL